MVWAFQQSLWLAKMKISANSHSHLDHNNSRQIDANTQHPIYPLSLRTRPLLHWGGHVALIPEVPKPVIIMTHANLSRLAGLRRLGCLGWLAGRRKNDTVIYMHVHWDNNNEWSRGAIMLFVLRVLLYLPFCNRQNMVRLPKLESA